MILDGAINHYVYNKMEIRIGGSGSVTIVVSLIVSGFIYYLFYSRYIKTSLYLNLCEKNMNEVMNKSFWRFISIMYIMIPLLTFIAFAIIWHK